MLSQEDGIPAAVCPPTLGLGTAPPGAGQPLRKSALKGKGWGSQGTHRHSCTPHSMLGARGLTLLHPVQLLGTTWLGSSVLENETHEPREISTNSLFLQGGVGAQKALKEEKTPPKYP